MPHNLYNRFGNIGQNRPSNNNILSQFIQLRRNPGMILDIMLQNGKINQQQYNDLQQYRNNPEMICMYLINNGKANEINQAQQTANQFGDNSNLM